VREIPSLNVLLFPLEIAHKNNKIFNNFSKHTMALVGTTAKRQAILFPEGDENSEGYVLSAPLSQGQQGHTFLVRSLSTGAPYVRKKFFSKWETDEAKIYPFLPSHIAPTLIHHTKYEYKGDALIYELCDGGDLFQFFTKIILKNNIIPEVLVWELARQLTELLAYIHNGWSNGKHWDIEKKGLWKSIVHRDIHIGNVLLDWPADKCESPFPRFLMADWAQSIHLLPFNTGNGKGNYNRRRALKKDIDWTLECFEELDHWRPDIKPENDPIWIFRRLQAEAETICQTSEDGRVQFDTASYIADRFVPLAVEFIAKEQAREKVDFRWTKPFVVDGIVSFDGEQLDTELIAWAKEHKLGKLPVKPWTWIAVHDIPKGISERKSTKKRPIPLVLQENAAVDVNLLRRLSQMTGKRSPLSKAFQEPEFGKLQDPKAKMETRKKLHFLGIGEGK